MKAGLEAYQNCLSYAEIRLQIRFSGNGTLPPYRGATLRGAFGYTLKKTVCHVKGGDCRSCPVMTGCVYSTLFEGIAPPGRTIMTKYSSIPQPFVFVLEAAEDTRVKEGQHWSFGMRLFGPAIKMFPYLAYTVIQMGKQGLGRDKIPYQVIQAWQVKSDGTEKLLYSPDNPNILHADIDWPVLEIAEDGKHYLQVKYLTPVKYRYRGHLHGRADFIPLMTAVMRRIRIVSIFYGRDLLPQINVKETLSAADQIELIEDNTQLEGFNRFSNRQKTTMRMGGIIGKAIYYGNFEQLMAALKLAELTHVGKSTSFGFGRIAVDHIKREAP